MQPPDGGWYSVNKGRGRGDRGRGRGRGNTSERSSYSSYYHGEASSSKGRGNTSKYFDPRKDPEYQEFLKNKEQNKAPEKTNIVLSSSNNDNEEDENIDLYHESNHTEIIFLIDYKDLKWRNDPWFIMTRYLSTTSYCGQTYKTRHYYECLLNSTETCFISHTDDKKNGKSYKYSKIVIKKIISVEEWGTSPYREKECKLGGENPIKYNYNYWDYIQAFSQVFYYENNEKKHSWFIKICAEAYEAPFPNWFVNWWTYFGPSIKLLPEIWQDYYLHWLDYSPTIRQMTKEGQVIEETGPLHFFIEFTIPWIVRWVPKLGKSDNGIPCIRRHYYSKLWTKMFTKNKETQELVGKDTEELILKALNKYEKMSQETIEEKSLETLTRNMKMKQSALSSKEILEAHLNQVRETLMKNFPGKFTTQDFDNIEDFWEKSDTDMASNASRAAGEAQDPYEDEGDTVPDQTQYKFC